MRSFAIFFGLVLALSMVGCKSKSPAGERVRTPFSGSKYESNNRFFRAVGQATSGRENIARSRAEIDAKGRLASQVETNIRRVADDYIAETQNANASDIAEKFQSLTREVMDTELNDIRVIGEEKFYNGEQFTVYVALEIRKNAMFRFMRQRARTDARIDKMTLKAIEEILDAEIKKSED